MAIITGNFAKALFPGVNDWYGKEPNQTLIVLEQIDPYPFEPLNLRVVPVNLAKLEDWTDALVLYGGGTDVNPQLYGEVAGVHTDSPDYDRDRYEASVFHTFQARVKGFVGICRGSQFLTAMSGGKLIQHIPGHGRDHAIQTHDGRIMFATSTHHQMMWPYELPKEEYQVLAEANPKRAKGVVPIEPEIVWYPRTKCLCIQGHPEYLGHGHPFSQYCRELVRDLLLDTKVEIQHD